MPKQQISEEEFIKNPHMWPNWPILPLKRGPQNNEIALLFEGGDGQYKISYGTNMFQFLEDTTEPKWEPTTAMKVISEGWRVD